MKGEYDVLAVEGGGRNRVFLVEVKSSAIREYILDFIISIEKFRALFKEYQDREIVPIFASHRLEDDESWPLPPKTGFTPWHTGSGIISIY